MPAFAFRLSLLAAALALAPPVDAQETHQVERTKQTPIEMRAQQVVRLLNGDVDEQPGEIFTDAFVAAVPPEQLKAISQQLTAQFGAAISVEALDPRDGTRAMLAIRLERAIAKGAIAVDPANGNRISELLFQAFDPIDDSPTKISADLRALPGKANALFARVSPDGSIDPVFAHNADTQLALGSTFKLYVLSALAGAVDRGERSWADVIPLTAKSLPSGQMQDWPAGAPVTLQTLATMMISISDNTATDQLIATLGRKAVEAELIASGNSNPSATIPLMTTRQLFAMRGVSDELIERYRKADDAGQRTILDGLTEADVSQEKVAATFANETPGAIDIEWFASPNDLAQLLVRVNSYKDPSARSVMAVAPQLTGAQREAWDYVGFKGGSEPGVLNFTWLLRDKNGGVWIATVGWNNPAAKVDTTALYAIAQRMLALPR